MARKSLYGRMKISRLSSNYVHDWKYSRLRNALPAITVSSGAELERAGQPIGIHDMMIGGHARGEGLTVVTTNIRESSACRGFVLKIGSRHKAVGKPGLPSTRRWGGAAWG